MWLGVTGGALATAGMAGYVGGRLTADHRLVWLVLSSTYVLLAGLVLFAIALFINTPRMRRPMASWALGGLLILDGVLLVAFPYDRAAAIPMAAIAALLVLSLVAGWNDLCNPQLWKNP
jgi:drug/metabolite transporter (DMT)-like permease